MSVKLDFQRPRPDGTLPLLDEEGVSWSTGIAPSRWATLGDHSGLLREAGLGLSQDWIPPDRLVAGARLALYWILSDVAYTHRAVEDLLGFGAGPNRRPEAYVQVFYRLASGESWWCSDPDKLKAVAAYCHEPPEGSGQSRLEWVRLLDSIIDHGLAGYYGLWSY